MNFESLLQKPVHPGIVQTARYFEEIAPGDALPKRHDFRPERISRTLLGFVFLIDVLPQERDYTFNLLGEHVVVLFGIDGHHSRLSEFPDQTLFGRLRRTYDAVVESRTFLYVKGRYAWPDRAVEIERLLVPLTDENGAVISILGMTIPNIPVESLVVCAGIGAARLEIDETVSG